MISSTLDIKNLLLVVCLLSTTILFGQIQPVKSTLTMRNGSTLNGFIHTPEYKLTDKEILFSATEKGTVTAYSAVEIASFMYQNRRYEGQIMEIDKSPISENQLKLGDTLVIALDTFFMEEVANGSLSLYEYIDANFKPHYFIKDMDSKVSELPFSRKRVEIAKPGRGKSGSGIQTKEGYKNVLGFLMEDCRNIDGSIKDARYTRKSLSKIFNTYYGCVGESKNKIHEARGGNFRVDLLGGLMRGSVKEYFSPVLDSYGFEAEPFVGVGFEYAMKGRLQNVSVRYDISYLIATSEEATFTNAGGNRIDYLSTYTFKGIKNTFGARIYGTPRKVRSFMNVGFGFMFPTAHRIKSENVTSNILLLQYADAENATYRHITIGYGVLALNRFGASLNVEFGRGLLPYVANAAKVWSLNAECRYRLFDSGN